MKHTVEKSRREYNRWVADESLEDYALRYSPASFRKWSPWLLANTALGGISFLALEAIGAVLLLNYGFSNAFWAILLASVIIFIAGVPISYYAARYNIDIDLLTRSAGFGYVGSTVTSLIYASFCFIFFALEAAIMAQALKLYFAMPLQWGYLFCSLIIIPIVFYGVTLINELHRWTQPIWLILMLLPFYFVFTLEPEILDVLVAYSGEKNGSNDFDVYYFGLATGISFALIAQIGEQVDYLRFMPDKQKSNQYSWWFALLIAGPGWIILGCLKQWAGALLAALVVFTGLGVADAHEPVQMYLAAYYYVFDNPETAILVSTVFVVISQIKINVTNAYAGSLAWSNFFSRLTHTHPGRVVWLVFNIAIALLLMELGVFNGMNKVLGLYSNVAVAWVFAVFADLVINKPLKLSPAVVEFKRAHLYDINPVGFGSMLIASVVSILAFTGIFGDYAQAYSWLIAMLLSLILSPLIAWATQGKYYLARTNDHFDSSDHLVKCDVCEQNYAAMDMAYCPFHDVPICSLCCTLESSCHDQCKPDANRTYMPALIAITERVFKHKVQLSTVRRIVHFLFVATALLSLVGITFWLVLSNAKDQLSGELLVLYIQNQNTLFSIISVMICIAAWWVVLANESRYLAETELNEQNETLEEEIIQRQKIEKSLRDSEDAFRHLFEFSSDAILLIEKGLIVDANATSLQQLGLHSKADLLQCSPSKISPETQLDGRPSNEKSAAMIALALEKGFHSYEWQHIKQDGSLFLVDVSLTHMLLGGKQIIYAAWRDITERKKAEAEINLLAFYDPLTKLPNRRYLQEQIEQSIARSEREASKIALLILDLDRFKSVNDRLGHLAGDELLQQVAARISVHLREVDLVARLGGDEFVVLLEHIQHKEDAARIAMKIITDLEMPFQLTQSDDVYIGASIGISLYPDNGVSVEILLDNADMALYYAKDNGRGRFAYFSDQLTEVAQSKLQLEVRLRYALKHSEFVVFYQPQVDIASGEIIGAEALVRWQDPEHGLISPDNFIPLAEETGLIIELGRWVLHETCRQGKQWQDQGLKAIRLAVNVSARQFKGCNMLEEVNVILQKTQFPVQYLELEMTESALIEDQEVIIKTLNQLRERGVYLAIDDFGTGYSSLAYLKRFPLDVLKIDKSFIDDIPHDKSDMEISSTIIAMGKTLGFKVLAEGVETAEQLKFLADKGCNIYQGYLKSKPLDAVGFRQLLHDEVPK